MTPHRNQFGWFHVTNLGVDHFDIYDTPLDKVVFEYEVEVASERNRVEVHAFCWMTNHFHLIVYCPDGNLSRFMQRLEQQYVLKHNRAIGRKGPLFSGRFGSFPIGVDDEAPDDGLKVVARYVHRNPLDVIRLERLGSYGDSSYAAYLGRSLPRRWLRTDVLSELYGNDPTRLRVHTETPLLTDRTPAAGRRHDPFPIDDVLGGAASACGTTVTQLLRPTPGVANTARTLAALLVNDLRPNTSHDITATFGVANRRTVRRLAAKGKALRASEPAFAALYKRAVESIWTTSTSSSIRAA